MKEKTTDLEVKDLKCKHGEFWEKKKEYMEK